MKYFSYLSANRRPPLWSKLELTLGHLTNPTKPKGGSDEFHSVG